MASRHGKPNQSGEARRAVRYPTFRSVTRINQKLVALTGEGHEFTEHDERQIRQLLEDVRNAANDEDSFESIIETASLLIYRIAGGQHYLEGNKRTALAVAESFLEFNGYTVDIGDKSLLDVVSKVAVGQARLSNVRDSITKLIRSV